MRLAGIVTLAALLAGCGVAPAALPEGVTVSVFQGRFDRAERQLELKVSNGTDDTVTVTGATLDSSRFVAPARWDRPQDIPPGGARDLRVQLGEPDCGLTPARDEVIVEFTLADGRSGSARVTIDDVSIIDAINAEDCLAEAVTTLATIRPADTLSWTPGAQRPATLDLTVTPTGAQGSVSITEVRGTVLLSLIDDGGAHVLTQPVNVLVDADSGPSVIQLHLVPARCDPHAVAEDKRGTIFPLTIVTSGGLAGPVVVAVGETVRAELHAFYGDYCGLP